MNTTITSKPATVRNGISNFLLSVLALLGAVGILVFAAHVGTMHAIPAQSTNTASTIKIALDQHERQANAHIAQNVAIAYQEQRRGEWSAPYAATGQSAYLEHRRGEWAVSYVGNSQAAYHQQRKGEWRAGVLFKNADCLVLTGAAQARCLGVR